MRLKIEVIGPASQLFRSFSRSGMVQLLVGSQSNSPALASSFKKATGRLLAEALARVCDARLWPNLKIITV